MSTRNGSSTTIIMRMRMLLLLLVVVVLIPSPTLACGGLICEPQVPVLQVAEGVVFGVREKEEEDGIRTLEISMNVQILYDGPAESFSWVLPIMDVPTNINVSTDVLFDRLFDATRNTFSRNIVWDEATCTVPIEQIAPICSVAAEDGALNFDNSIKADVTILETDSVGPFDYDIVEGTGVFAWLQRNGYDQPPSAGPLIDYYSSEEIGMKFLAIKLQKTAVTGDIRPLWMTWESTSLTIEDAFGCIPIKLTAIAAGEFMPVQVYAFVDLIDDDTTAGPVEVVPSNYFHADLDLTQLDWLGCFPSVFDNNNVIGSSLSQDCMLNSLRANFRAEAAQQVESKAVYTEYNGPTADVVSATDTIALTRVNIAQLANAETPLEFLNLMADYDIPPVNNVHAIVHQFLPNPFPTLSSAEDTTLVDFPPLCTFQETVYDPTAVSRMETCLSLVDTSQFDPVAMATKLDIEVIQPAQEAQDWVNTFPHLTRMYTEFVTPLDMNKDQFFQIKVGDGTADGAKLKSQAVTATFTVTCDDEATPVAMDIDVVEDSRSGRKLDQISIGCGTFLDNGSTVEASQTTLVAYDVDGPGMDRVLVPGATGGLDSAEVAQVVALMDARVPNQTVDNEIPIPPPTPPSPTVPMTTSPPSAAAAAAAAFIESTSITKALLVVLLLTSILLPGSIM